MSKRVDVTCPYCDYQQTAVCAELDAHDTLERCLYCMTMFVVSFAVAVSVQIAAIVGRHPGAAARVAQHGARARVAEAAIKLPLPALDDSLSLAANVKRREQPAAPAASQVAAVPSQEGAGAATGGADSGTCEPAQVGKLNEQLDSEPAAGPLAGEQGLEPKRRKRFTPEQMGLLRTAYLHTLDLNDGELPAGWITQQAESMGVPYNTIYGRLRMLETEQPKRPPKQSALAALKSPARKHGNSHQCWCRKSPNSSANRWCSNAAPTKSPGTLAGLQESRPRRERELREVDA